MTYSNDEVPPSKPREPSPPKPNMECQPVRNDSPPGPFCPGLDFKRMFQPVKQRATPVPKGAPKKDEHNKKEDSSNPPNGDP